MKINYPNKDVYNVFDKDQNNKFGDNFIGNANFNVRTNENVNNINSHPSSAHLSEREKRLKLREQEKMKRMQGMEGGNYGEIE